MAHTRWQVVFATVTLFASALPASADSSCYMVTSSGRKISLAGMCSNGAAPTQSASPSRAVPSSTVKRSPSQPSDYLVKEGAGGRKNGSIAEDFHYQVWSNPMNTSYTLKVWRAEDYPNRSPFVQQSFRSVGEAEDYFDCRYTNKRLPACSDNR